MTGFVTTPLPKAGAGLKKSGITYSLKTFVSSQQSVTTGSIHTVAHGLGAKPRFVFVGLVCISTEGNWSVNEEIEISNNMSESATSEGICAYADATNINVLVGLNGLTAFNKSNGATLGLTSGNWELVMKAIL